jgi:hypothetical protein
MQFPKFYASVMVDEEETTTLSQNVRTDYAVIQVHIPESRNLQ